MDPVFNFFPHLHAKRLLSMRFSPLAIAASLAVLPNHALASALTLDFSFTTFSVEYSETADIYGEKYPGFGVWQQAVVNGVALPNQTSGTTAAPYTSIGSAGYSISTPEIHTTALSAGTNSVTFHEQSGWVWEDSGYKYSAWSTDSTKENAISFTPNDAIDVELGEIFKLGTFTVTNGSWYSPANGGNSPTELTFTIVTESDDPVLDGHIFSGTFMYRTALAVGGTDLQNADEYWIAELPELGSARVFEYGTTMGNIGSFDVYGYIGSLHINEFSNPTGGAVLTSTLGDLPAEVPLPASAWLLGSTLLGLFASKKRCKTATNI